MKKIIFYSLSASLTILLLISCEKPTRGKVTNKWNVIFDTEEIDGFTSVDNSITSNRFIIDKDGTWSWNKSGSTSGVVFGGSVFLTNKKALTQRGTWSFIQKTKGDDFKKNERILFNILFESSVASQTGGGNNPAFPDTTITDSHTYLTGEKAMIYTITHSTRKELWMESESLHVNSSNGQVSSKKVRLRLEANK
ncbi:hypothetical protein [Fluviicola sp.]|uniref:hypothetical protein n=1 Tax=Fluviicola sp. TaxID=1917219 RepID=UPI0031CE567E